MLEFILTCNTQDIFLTITEALNILLHMQWVNKDYFSLKDF